MRPDSSRQRHNERKADIRWWAVGYKEVCGETIRGEQEEKEESQSEEAQARPKEGEGDKRWLKRNGLVLAAR